MNVYNIEEGALRRLECAGGDPAIPAATWIDLLDPSREEENAVEAALAIDVPSREEMRSIEASSAVYHDRGASFMTARVMSMSTTSAMRLVDVTFILKANVLITLRYGDPLPFRTFVARAEKTAAKLASGEAVLVGLLEAIVDRVAELQHRIGDELDTMSSDIFTRDGSVGSSRRDDLRPVIQQVGRNGDLASRMRESLHSLTRVVPFLAADGVTHSTEDLPGRLTTVSRDITALLGHNEHLASKVTFLLDATLGLINIQQNGIIKILSVASVVFLPPTLIASIYGMNFKDIPELHWDYGYPYGLALMFATAVLPYLYFKWRRWL